MRGFYRLRTFYVHLRFSLLRVCCRALRRSRIVNVCVCVYPRVTLLRYVVLPRLIVYVVVTRRFTHDGVRPGATLPVNLLPTRT